MNSVVRDLGRKHLVGRNLLVFGMMLGVLAFAAGEEEASVPDGWTEGFPIDPDSGCICCFTGKLPEKGVLYARPPAKKELDAIVANILKYAGLAPNFRVVEVDEDNAYAMIRKGERILGFGDRYLRRISSKSGSDWGRLGVMAHEVGHHVQGHTVRIEEEPDSAHRRELEADEYAGFICGMMGASKVDAIAHTSLMSEVGSASHPPVSQRVEATERGWLMAQHIRRTVKEERACPVFQFTGDGIELRNYIGKISGNEVSVLISRLPDRTVFGSYEMAAEGEKKHFRFVGRSNEARNRITLEEYFGCEPSAKIYLSRSTGKDEERWTGKMVDPGGKEFPVEVSRTVAAAPTAEKEPVELPKNPRDLKFVTTLAGYSQRWLPVVSKNTPYTEQIYYQGKNFSLEFVRDRYQKGFRITDVAGDANGWAIVMSKGSGYGSQRVIGPGPINESQYADLRGTGFRVTSLAGYEDSWVMVMSQSSGLGDQRFTLVGDFKTSWIGKRLSEGYRITEVAGDDNETGGSWMVLMSKGTGFSQQVYSDGGGFPRDWIKARWDEGYRITSASGYDNWRVVMSKESGISFQTYKPPSSEFPDEFIRSKWGKPHVEIVEKTREDEGGVPGKLQFEHWIEP